LVQRFNSDLANGLGNLASRTLSMITRYFKGEVPYPSAAAARIPSDDAVAKTANEVIAQFNEHFSAFAFSRALESAWSLVATVDKYIVENEPWALADKQDETSRARLATILYTSAEALRIVTALAHPIIPDSTSRIWSQLGLGDIKKFDLRDLKWGQLPLGTKLEKVEGVFPRADKSAIERMQQMEQERTQAATADKQASATQAPSSATAAATTEQAPATQAATPAAPAPAAALPVGIATIGIDDLMKVELRVGLVKTAEKVEKADKLLKLSVDIGTEVRTIVAGIAEVYTPEQMLNRKIIIVANLAPRKLRGIESQGMLLAASIEGGKPVLAGFLEEVPIGARLK
jgi:methionyl-tRNA synthetase